MNNCKICEQQAQFCFNASVLNKYKVDYYKCSNCGFIQTEAPFWLDEAYQSAIAGQDIGLVYRNMIIAPILSTLINYHFNKDGKYIDYGGGYGMLTRIMRDKGFDFYRYDAYCENIFAKGFDSLKPEENPVYELLSSFEVFEHLVDPVGDLEKMSKWSTNIFFSTELQPEKLNSADDWWYIMPETGQHIALYTEKSLRHLGQTFGLNFYTNGSNLHLFTKQKLNQPLFKLLVTYRIAHLLYLFARGKRSLLMKDYELIKNNKHIK